MSKFISFMIVWNGMAHLINHAVEEKALAMGLFGLTMYIYSTIEDAIYG